ncbi:MAG: hypothetical protein ChlgKO_10870 [Chlamydiales bacterium]
MTTNHLERKVAKLESLCDQLQAERSYLNTLLKEIGFEEGLKTLKEAALEMLDRKSDDGGPPQMPPLG